MRFPPNDQFQEEFSIESKVRSFTVRATSMAERDKWVEAIHSAKEDFISKFKSLGVQLSEEAEIGLGDLAPVWIPDDRVAFCQVTN